jgi:hypothetical protein
MSRMNTGSCRALWLQAPYMFHLTQDEGGPECVGDLFSLSLCVLILSGLVECHHFYRRVSTFWKIKY